MIQTIPYQFSTNIRRAARTLLWRQAVLLYAVCFAVFSLILFAAPGFVGGDDYYHARVSAQIIEQGRLAISFPWLPQTILSPDKFVDHHLLFHIFLAPWVAVGGMVGAKLGTVAVAAAVWVAFWALLRQIGVQRALFWTLILFGLSTPFLIRLLMIRTQGAALLFLILMLLGMFSGRYRLIIPLAFGFVWLYNGFVLLLFFAASYSAARWIAERKLDLRPVVYCLIGLILGLIINPYFPANVQFITDHLGAKVDLESGIRVGAEWYPYTTGALLTNSAGALLLLAVGFLRQSFAGRRQRDTVESTLLFVALITLFMLFRSRRFIEYYPPFALLFCAAAWGRGGLTPWAVVSHYLPFRLPSRLRAILSTLALSLPVALLIGLTLNDTYLSARTSTSPDYMAGAARWLRDNTPPGAPVFQTDWDDFPYLYYYNQHNIYLVGMDPTYLELAHPDLWDLWVEITRGEIEQPSDLILTDFGARYVVSDTRHPAFARQARADPAMKLVYEDEHSMVWQIEESTPPANP